MQSAQSVSAAYYFDPPARDYTLAAGAIELVVEGVPFSASIEPSQSCELIFCARLDRPCEGESMAPMVASSVAICKNKAGARRGTVVSTRAI